MFRFIITATVFIFLSACSMQVYKLNIQQGNIVTQDMLEKLKPGMDKRQVSYIMGNPVLKDTFSTTFWDYAYRTERYEDDVKSYSVRIYFDQAEKYTHYEGELPESTQPELQDADEKPIKLFGE